MPLPDNFSPWEHLQTVLKQVHNRIVRDEFNDIEDDDDIATPRGSLKKACLLDDSDSAIMTALRYWLFYVDLRKAADLHPPLYTMPTDRYQQSVKFAPQVTLLFKEDIEDVDEGYSPLDAEISFRIMDETSNSMTEAKARTLANKIKTEFSSGGGYRWHKGRTKLSYRDKENGYQFSVNAYSETEGKAVINKVLDLQNNTLDLDLLSIAQLGDNPPTIPPAEFIYGQSRRTARRRPIGYVRFICAEMHLWGIPNAITLIDRSGRRKNPLVNV